MELKNDNHPLLDRITVYGFQIVDISDIDHLIDIGIAVRKVRSKFYINTEYGEIYSSINIGKTQLFDSLIYSIGVDGHVYGQLELSVNDDGYHNLNCHTFAGYKSQLHNIKSFLLANYGISVDFSKAKLKKVEINKTIVINDKFSTYQRPLSLLMYLLPGQLRLKSENMWVTDKSKPYKATDYERTIKTYYKTSGSRGITVKIYDKTEQLEAAFAVKTKVPQ